MKRILIIAAVIATGLSVQAQTLVLSDSYDTGLAFATNDLNYNLVARQSGTATTNGLFADTNLVTLSAAGKLHMTDASVASTDWLSSEIGANSYSIKLKGQQAVSASNWSMIGVRSATNSNWDSSPININLWHHNWVHLMYGDINDADLDNLLENISPDMVTTAIGTTYNASDEHTFEIRTVAESATSGTWGFSIDGQTLAAGLPYTFEDANQRMEWVTDLGGGSDSSWDDLEISIIPTVSPEYLFFDDFNGSDHSDINILYGNRQTNGIIVSPSPYSGDPTLYNVTNNVLHQYATGQYANLTTNLAPHIVGNDYEFSFKMAMLETNSS